MEGSTSALSSLHDNAKLAHRDAVTPETRAAVLRLALSQTIGLPSRDAVSGLVTVPPAADGACGLCEAALVSAPSLPKSDKLLAHVSACKRQGVENTNLARHNALVRAAAGLARECGIDAKAHDGPIFELGVGSDAKKRPADWLERGCEITPKNAATFYSGRCCDLTIRTGDHTAMTAAVKEKERKYARGMARHPSYGLSVVAITHSGQYSQGARETLARWAFHLTKRRKATAELPGRPLEEIRAAFGYAFALVMAQQLVGYANTLAEHKADRHGEVRQVSSMDRLRSRWRQRWASRESSVVSHHTAKRYRAAARGGKLERRGDNQPSIGDDTDWECSAPSMGDPEDAEVSAVVTNPSPVMGP